ncbi:MAG: JAB domain-containing protein [Candidatus Dormibacteraeota bacterium]|nr:JAB domain-containing protein [Candidatus Dormibacteraeota bacterium]MBV9525403.1 JAB domain-containing protein [Candidatus Dormibacteraeota bacterium]
MHADASPWAEFGEAELIARALGGAEPGPELRSLGARLCRIPMWERRAAGEAGLVRDHGVAAPRAARLAAMWELAERWYPDDRPTVGSPRDAVLLMERLRSAPREEVVVLLLDARHRPIALDTVAVGTVNASRLAPRDVFTPAIRRHAVAVIIGHNHPSGDASPSRADRTVTAALRSAGDLLGVPVLDHVIVTRLGHHSFRDAEGWEVDAVA